VNSDLLAEARGRIGWLSCSKIDRKNSISSALGFGDCFVGCDSNACGINKRLT
jgi:hypothetical protein